MATIADELIARSQTRRPEWIDFVRQLVCAESPSANPDLHDQVMALLADELSEAGYDTRRFPGEKSAGQLFAVPRIRRRGRPYQLLIGHCDTVWPKNTLADMPVAVDGNRMSGPGIFDMKAGLVNTVFALQALSSLELVPTVTPVVLITTDEEVGSAESRGIIERLARQADRALVLEPALGISGKIKTARKGTGDYRITVKGKAAHAGLAPEEGASAILEMSHVIQHLFQLNDPSRGITVNVGTVGGGLRSNVIAPKSSAEVDVRVLTREDAVVVDNAIRNLKPAIEGVTLKIDGGFERPPMERTPRNLALWDTCRAIGRHIGLALEEATAGGASDGNFTSQFCATLDGLGPVGHGAHARHEHVLIDETIQRCVLLALILLAPPAGSRG